MTLDQIRKNLNEPTFARRRAEAMGFRFGPVSATSGEIPWMTRVNTSFTCLCGRQEFFTYYISGELSEDMGGAAAELYWQLQTDVAAKLQALGSFSREHLLADGYAHDQVAEILARGEAFDRVNRRSL